MGRQIDDPGFDPENDEWVGTGARWDQHPSLHSTSNASSVPRSVPRKQKAPPITEEEFTAAFELLDSGGFAMTYDRCLAELRMAGMSHLETDHVALVAELTGIRSSPRQWASVPAPIARLGRTLARERARRRRKRR